MACLKPKKIREIHLKLQSILNSCCCCQMCWLLVYLFLHEERPYEPQCILLTGWVKSRMHFTVSLDLDWSTADVFRQFEGPVYVFLHFNSLNN